MNGHSRDNAETKVKHGITGLESWVSVDWEGR
jgi:hypothetical protein